MNKDSFKPVSTIPIILCFILSCVSEPDGKKINEETSADDVSAFIQSFEGRGDLSDDSQPTPAQEAVKIFTHPEDLIIDLVLAEPDILQPVEIGFDHRGRLWVVQYNQYPYPEGLKITSIDNHLRVQFDKVPEAPPQGTQGADKIVFFEDLDGDGSYEKSTDAITGLNIATSVVLGLGKIWVLNPPYLLAYPDPDDDGIPNGDPEVHLKGFGLEDTHAVANSLTWGPDGWLYGAQGSTTTANISSAISKSVRFQGQAIWRYHPETQVFEIFAEGGGNTFDIEMDSKGRIYSGDNGTDRGQYYKQGAYYIKNWGKHGPHSNPYTFGNLSNMALEGDRKRFTHAWIKYEGGSLPDRYQNKMVAINPLQSYLQLTRFETNGSTFKNIDEGRILETTDQWFRPVDIKSGPDGALYLADWYDSRLSHVDPRDTWHKKSGRVYRIRSAQSSKQITPFNLGKLTDDDLIDQLKNPNKWMRQQALLQIASRKNLLLLPRLQALLKSKDAQLALEALWAIQLIGGFDPASSLFALKHQDPFVRMWGIRLIGDTRKVSTDQEYALIQLTRTETHPEVRSQLAATAKRLPAATAIPLIKNLILHEGDISDPDIPLQIWWALESKIDSDRNQVVNLFKDPALWKSAISQSMILSNLVQRLILSGSPEDYRVTKMMIGLAPSPALIKPVIAGMMEGLRGKDMGLLPSDLLEVLKPYASLAGEGPLAIGLRRGDSLAISGALEAISNSHTNLPERISYVKILGEIHQPKALSTLLNLIENQKTAASLKRVALQSLQSYPEPEVGKRVAAAYPDKLRSDPEVRLTALSLLSSRTAWAGIFLQMIDSSRQVPKSDVPSQLVMQFSLLNDPKIEKMVYEIWPETKPFSEAKKEESLANVNKILKSGTGDRGAGQKIFQFSCSACHKLGELGGDLGPDLSTYDRRNVQDMLYNIIDPNADVREGYVNYLLQTLDHQTLIGTIESQEGDAISLRTSTGERINLATAKVKEIKALDRSLMPEGLLDQLSDQQIRDLFAFMRELP